MGFFSDLKADLSQAMGELLPETQGNIKTDQTTESEAVPSDIFKMLEEAENAASANLQTSDSEEDETEAEQNTVGEEPTEDTTLDDTATEIVPDEAADDIAEESEEDISEEALEEPAREEILSEESAEEPADLQMETDIPVEEAVVATEETAEEEEPEYTGHYDLEGMLEKALREEGIIIDEPEPEKISAEASAEDDEAVAEPEEDNAIKGDINMIEANTERELVDETSVISSCMNVKGDISTAGNLDVVGTVEGNIDVSGKLSVTGYIEGNSSASEVFADGAKICGEILSAGTVKIGASSVVVGNITASSAAIAGAVKGDIDVKGPVILDTTAIVMGNIRSKSVQINNGAIIEGMCSQCYADIPATSFFDEFNIEKKSDKKAK